MPRCDGCGNRRCSCAFVDGQNTQVGGTGSAEDPFHIDVDIDAAGGTRIVGEIMAYGGAAAPPGWLLANGQAVSRTTYSDLFAILGTNFGPGDGSTTFNVPDIAGRFAFGADGTTPRGTAGGAAERTLAVENLPAHHHVVGPHDHPLANAFLPGPGYMVGTLATGSDPELRTGPSNAFDTSDTGSGTPVPILPPYTAVTYLIKT